MSRFFLLFLLSQLCHFATANELWKKPVIIGASVADGYHHSERIGGVKSEALSLENYLSKLIKVPHGKITNLGNKFYFLRPGPIASKQVINAAKLQPSVILTPDFLFWLIYGNFNSEQHRINLFKKGLKNLETFRCPVIVGNIPNASKAVHKMLSYSQIPKLETIKTANRILKAWAAKHRNISIVNLDQFMQSVNSNETVALRHIIYPKGSTRQLLQTDNLHPTSKGVTAICLTLLEALQKQTNFPDSDIHWQKNTSEKTRLKPDSDVLSNP